MPSAQGDRAGVRPGDERCQPDIDDIESALNSLGRSTRQSRLHDFIVSQAGTDLDQAGSALLYVLQDEACGLRVTDLAERLHIDAPAVTRKAQQLERAGLLSRTRDRADGRASWLQLTAPGRRAIGRVLEARRVWLATVLSEWPDAERAELARLLRKFSAGIDRHLGELDG